MSQQDQHASELNHAEEVCSVAFPSAGDASKILQPSEQPFNFPAAPIAAQWPTMPPVGGWIAAKLAVQFSRFNIKMSRALFR
jgi:hypothetical protein